MSIAEKTLQLKEDFAEVYEAGKQKARSDFWDSYQNYGERTDYSYAFYNNDWIQYYPWNGDTIKPKYDIVPTTANRMFYRVKGIEDLGKHFEELGIKFDLSKATNVALTFPYIDCVKLPIIDCSNATTIDNTFNYCSNLETIEKLVLSEKLKSISGPCIDCYALKNIVIEGVIPVSISFNRSPLTVASLKSIITHLKDYTGTSNEFSYTVTLKATAFAELENEGATAEYNGVACTWRELIDNFKWNLVLVG